MHREILVLYWGMKSAEYLQESACFPEYLKPFIENMDDVVRINESVFGLRPKITEQILDLENKQRTLLIVTGFSGAGKDTVVNALIENDERFGWVRTCTTRDRRPDENDENDTYIRITEQQFQEKLKDGDVIEWIEYAGQHSCSMESVFMEAFSKYEIPIIRVDPRGTRFYTEMWKRNERFFKNVNLVSVFVAPPNICDLESRLWGRPGANSENVKKRMIQMGIDIPFLGDSEYIAINETNKLEKVVENIQKLLDS
jgi:guanylate kinase